MFFLQAAIKSLPFEECLFMKTMTSSNFFKLFYTKIAKLLSSKSLYRGAAIFLLTFTLSCAGLSPDLSQNSLLEPSFPEEGAKPEEDISLPYPGPIAYLEYLIEGKAELSMDQKTIHVKGVTLLKETMTGASTKLHITKNDEAQVYEIFSNSEGYFALDLPADPNKTTEYIRLVTKNDEGESSSDVLTLFVDKLYGFWRGGASIDWEKISNDCFEQLPDIGELENFTRVFLYKPKPYQGIYWLNFLGMRYPFELKTKIGSMEMEIHSSEMKDFDETQGFPSHLKTGCYEQVDFWTEGKLNPKIELDGIYINGRGEFQAILSGSEESCLPCHIQGAWDFYKFLPAWVLDVGDSDALYEIDQPQEKNIEIDYEIISESIHDAEAKNIIPDGPLKKMIPITSNILLGITAKKLYQIHPNTSQVHILLESKKLSGNLIFKDILQIDSQYSVLTFHDSEVASAGFFLFKPASPEHIQRIDLPSQYSQILSPVWANGQLYTIGTNFDDEKHAFNNASIDSERKNALLFYDYYNGEFSETPTWIWPLKLHNPIALKLISDHQLWIFDGSFPSSKINFKSPSSGAVEIILLNPLSSEPILSDNVFMPQWRTRLQSGEGISDSRHFGEFKLIQDYNKLFISGRRFSYWIDLQSIYLPPQNQGEALNQMNLIRPLGTLATNIFSLYAGAYPIIFSEEFEDYNYWVEFSSWEENTGLILSVMGASEKKTLEAISHSTPLIYYPINYWETRGAVAPLGKTYVVSMGQSLYVFKIKARAPTSLGGLAL